MRIARTQYQQSVSWSMSPRNLNKWYVSIYCYVVSILMLYQLSRGTGQPTCVAVGQFVAVGLSTGTVLVFGG